MDFGAVIMLTTRTHVSPCPGYGHASEGSGLAVGTESLSMTALKHFKCTCTWAWIRATRFLTSVSGTRKSSENESVRRRPERNFASKLGRSDTAFVSWRLWLVMMGRRPTLMSEAMTTRKNGRLAMVAVTDTHSP